MVRDWQPPPSAGLTLYQLPDFAPLNTIVEGNVGATAWSPDGRFIAGSGSNQTVFIWDSSDGSVVNQLAGGATALAWGPNSEQLLIGPRQRAGCPLAHRRSHQ
ncbi:MAG: hypothetical protein H6652_03980 [Ardenticatenaceae bacterium]|nr:hypothetical protein [Ardenticatenaceae bacterium]